VLLLVACAHWPFWSNDFLGVDMPYSDKVWCSLKLPLLHLPRKATGASRRSRYEGSRTHLREELAK